MFLFNTEIKSSQIKDHEDQEFTYQRSWRSIFYRSKIMEIKISQIKDHGDQEFTNQRSRGSRVRGDQN